MRYKKEEDTPPKRMKRKRLLRPATLSLFLLFAGLFATFYFLRSDRFQEMTRRSLSARLEEATGLRCAIAKFRLDPLRGAFQIEGLSLSSPPDVREPVRISLDRVSGSFGIPAPWQLRVHLSSIEILRPRIELPPRRQQASSGLSPEALRNAVRTSLDFSVGRLMVRDGSILWQDRKVPFHLSLQELSCEVHHRSGPDSYRITLSYGDSDFQIDDRELSHRMSFQGVLSMEGIEIDALEAGRGRTSVSAKGALTNWESPRLTLLASAHVFARDLSVFTPIADDAQGYIDLDTNLRMDPAGLFTSGKFHSSAILYRGAPVSDVQGNLAITETVLSLRDVTGKLGTGSFQGDADIQLKSGTEVRDKVNLRLEKGLLVNIARILEVPEIAFLNKVDGKAEISWRKGNADLVAEGNAFLHGIPEPEGIRSTALQGPVDFRFEGLFFYILNADLRSPYSTVQLARTEGRHFSVHATTSLISEPLAILSGLSTDLKSTLERNPDLLSASGTYELTGDAEIRSMQEVHYRGQFRATRPRWRSYWFDAVSTTGSWIGRSIEMSALNLRRGDESVRGDLSIVLSEDPGGTPDVSFRGAVKDLSLSALEALPSDFGISGRLNGSGAVSCAKGIWEGNGHFELNDGAYRGERFDRLKGTVQMTERLLRLTAGEIDRGAVHLDLQGQVELQGKQEIHGTVRLAALPLRDIPIIRERKIDLDGRLEASGELLGSIPNPSFSGGFTLEGLRYEVWDLGKGKGTIELGDGRVRAVVAVRSGLGSFEGHGEISTEPGFPGRVDLQFRDWNAQRILAGRLPSFLSDVSTALQGNIELEGRFGSTRTVNARGSIEGGRFKVRDYELRNSGAVRFTVADQKLRFEKATLVGDGTNLDLSGTIPLDNTSTLDLALNGPLNLTVLEQPQKRLRVLGSASLNVKATGNLPNPQVAGKASLENARLSYSDLPFQLSALQGDIYFSRDLIRIEKVQGNVASGTLQISGFLEPRNGTLANSELQIRLQRARLPYPADFRSVVDARFVLRGSADSQLLTGDINVLRTEYLRDLNVFELMLNPATAPMGPQVPDPLLLGLQMDVSVHSDNGLLIDNALTKLRGGFRLQVRGSPAYPSVTGHIEASEGTIFFRGNKFEIMHATGDLSDRNRINPVLDIRAEADVRAYRLILTVNGNLDRLKPNITSDPPLATVDIVNLLATGKSTIGASTSMAPTPTSESSRYQTEVTGVSAASLLSESITGVLGKRVERIFGLQSFRVDPFLAGAENDPTARVTISERISKNFTVTFSRNLSTNEEQIVMVEYEVSRNFSIVSTRDEQGQFGLDFRIRRRYR